ncbi:transthyretin-like family protein [Calycomorphotria hydatis]|uniref:Nickel uptake substrate-specific transmembrane region n=1 Tax=Calycomorphotria hydatis TaxID=2528027 RepID=A0A517TAW0_9PLAN|nr:hypothetical protein [Calycomorphotria hydatis]QDT65507.1 hypothetical protein V22_27610 [Calycomorphotria hydatis]
MKRSLTTLTAALFLATLPLLWGCSRETKYDVVPVSGTITVGGQPAAHVLIRFKPIAQDGDTNPGRSSIAFANENGEFQLQTESGKLEKGAIVGPHQVVIFGEESISAISDWQEVDPAAFPPDSKLPERRPVPTLAIPRPDHWPLEFTVPEAGTDSANFEL